MNVIYKVQSSQRMADTAAISVSTHLSTDNDFKLFAAVMKGGFPVLNAKVEGVFEISNQTLVLNDYSSGKN